jgi:hypothetical protein
MQKLVLTHDTDSIIWPLSTVDADDHDPLYLKALPFASTATQNVLLTHDTESSA